MPVRSSQVSFSTKNIDLAGLYFVPGDAAEADSASSPDVSWPGIVMLHDYFGLDEWTVSAAQRLAEAGFAVAVPNLFHASGEPKDIASATALLDFTMGLADSDLIGYAISALNWLGQRPEVRPGAYGMAGWGWGGAYALMAGAYDARISAVADIGGAISYPAATARKPGSPLNFVASLNGPFFAAFPSGDPLLPLNEVDRLRARLKMDDKQGEVKIYSDTPAHFWRDAKLPQTELLWRRLGTFLDDNIQLQEVWSEGYPNEELLFHA